MKYSQSVLRGHLGEALKVATYNRWHLISLCLPKVIWSLYMIFFVQYVNITGLSLQTNEILLTWLNLLFILWSCCNNFWFIIKKRIICNSQCTALYFKCNISNATHYYLYLGKPIPNTLVDETIYKHQLEWKLVKNHVLLCLMAARSIHKYALTVF